jgi:hypothetical protein
MSPDALVSADPMFHQALNIMFRRRRFTTSASAGFRRRCCRRRSSLRWFNFHFIDHYWHDFFSLLQLNSKTSSCLD